MACEHKRLRCTDDVFYCLDCGAKVEVIVEADHVTSASGRKIGFEAEKPKRRAKKGATKD